MTGGPRGLPGPERQMGDLIRYDFRRRVRIGRDEWLAGAARCERASLDQPTEIAATLRRCAERYRQAAEGAG